MDFAYIVLHLIVPMLLGGLTGATVAGCFFIPKYAREGARDAREGAKINKYTFALPMWWPGSWPGRIAYAIAHREAAKKAGTARKITIGRKTK